MKIRPIGSRKKWRGLEWDKRSASIELSLDELNTLLAILRPIMDGITIERFYGTDNKEVIERLQPFASDMYIEIRGREPRYFF